MIEKGYDDDKSMNFYKVFLERRGVVNKGQLTVSLVFSCRCQPTNEPTNAKGIPLGKTKKPDMINQFRKLNPINLILLLGYTFYGLAF